MTVYRTSEIINNKPPHEKSGSEVKYMYIKADFFSYFYGSEVTPNDLNELLNLTFSEKNNKYITNFHLMR